MSEEETVRLSRCIDTQGKLWLRGQGWHIEDQSGRIARPGSPLKVVGYRFVHESFLEALQLGLNRAEREVYARLRQEGKQVLRGGWPDLLVVDGDETYGVEVKTPKDRVSPRQQEMHDALSNAGIRVEVVIER